MIEIYRAAYYPLPLIITKGIKEFLRRRIGDRLLIAAIDTSFDKRYGNLARECCNTSYGNAYITLRTRRGI